MVEISFLGGGREVGRMGILIDNGSQRLLLDYGVSVETMAVPIEPPKPPHALLLSHAHLDHSGNIPSLYSRGWEGRVYATPATFEIADMLLKDSHKVQKLKGMHPRYDLHDVAHMGRQGVEMHFGRQRQLKSASFTLNDAGHVPGSSSILIETGGKRILYTGDIKLEDTLLMRSAFRDFRDIDILITESTYSYKNHPPRQETVRRIRDKVRQSLQSGGFVVLPCFAVGRAQEMLLAIKDIGYPVYMDGMCIGATKAVLAHKEAVRDHALLGEAMSRVRKIRSQSQRKHAIRDAGVVITTAGMLNGGPVHFYIRELHDRPECAMILNGFQIPGTVGRTLMDTGVYVHEDMEFRPRMSVDFMDLSAHAGRDEIIDLVKDLNPGKVFLVHGERTEEFAADLKGMGFDAAAPKNGDSERV